jgi:hypothetical protein
MIFNPTHYQLYSLSSTDYKSNQSKFAKYIKVEIPQFTELECRIAELEKLFPKKKPSSPYASVEEAQDYLKCSYSKIRRLIDRGFLKKNLGSRHIQIFWSSLYAYVGTTASS